ncbi:hypothetical protein [Halovenus halobia]|uniref:hypothetical protein n=1 Tax=Halovenus halobia TaxID=3396622 RepID=UPI003F571BB1
MRVTPSQTEYTTLSGTVTSALVVVALFAGVFVIASHPVLAALVGAGAVVAGLLARTVWQQTKSKLPGLYGRLRVGNNERPAAPSGR